MAEKYYHEPGRFTPSSHQDSRGWKRLSSPATSAQFEPSSKQRLESWPRVVKGPGTAQVQSSSTFSAPNLTRNQPISPQYSPQEFLTYQNFPWTGSVPQPTKKISSPGRLACTCPSTRLGRSSPWRCTHYHCNTEAGPSSRSRGPRPSIGPRSTCTCPSTRLGRSSPWRCTRYHRNTEAGPSNRSRGPRPSIAHRKGSRLQ